MAKKTPVSGSPEPGYSHHRLEQSEEL